MRSVQVRRTIFITFRSHYRRTEPRDADLGIVIVVRYAARRQTIRSCRGGRSMKLAKFATAADEQINPHLPRAVGAIVLVAFKVVGSS